LHQSVAEVTEAPRTIPRRIHVSGDVASDLDFAEAAQVMSGPLKKPS
jgi:hypothetical protein